MSPLLQRVLKASLKSSPGMTLDYRKLISATCFDVSEVEPLIRQMEDEILPSGLIEQSLFLPADITWVETEKFGFLAFKTEENPHIACVNIALPTVGGHWLISFIGLIALSGSDDRAGTLIPNEKVGRGIWGHVLDLYSALAIINSPKIVVAETAQTHRGFKKKFATSTGFQPREYWTKIRLQAIDRDSLAGGGIVSGEKCLHFCRSHLRIRNGKLERVRSHWRGNPAVGVKQSNYRVTA